MQQLRLRRIEVELRGLPVARAYRSYGSMIHFQFGELHLEKSGEYGLMVEIAAWKITRWNGDYVLDNGKAGA